MKNFITVTILSITLVLVSAALVSGNTKSVDRVFCEKAKFAADKNEGVF